MTMQKLWVNLIPRGNNTSELVFCWKSNHNKAKEFVDSFMSLETSKLATALTWLCFEHFENLAISPIWWDSMRAMRRVVLGKRFLNSMDVDIERQANYLEFGTRRFTDWVVTELAEDTA